MEMIMLRFLKLLQRVGKIMIKLRNRSAIYVNGDLIHGSNVSVQTINGKTTVKVDGQVVAEPQVKLEIIIQGNAEQVNIPVCHSLRIEGNAEHVNTVSGDVMVTGDASNVETVSGDVSCSRANKISTLSGDVLQNYRHD